MYRPHPPPALPALPASPEQLSMWSSPQHQPRVPPAWVVPRGVLRDRRPPQGQLV
jgi:hypothetical protein